MRRWARYGVVAWVLAVVAVAPSARAGPPFVWPVACRHGEDCWIVRHVDRDPGPGVLDVACGRLSGDGHAGTDIALADLSVLARGVAVLAPAAGTVVGVRDGMPDIATDAAGAPPLDGRNCGNGVRLEHAGGWVSQLCHLRRGSILVRPGDRVAAGTAIGLVGLSGETSFPHLHVGFEHDGRPIDPMDGRVVEDGADCGAVEPLFAEPVRYVALPLVGAGMAPHAPADADLLRGWHRAEALPSHAPALVVWMHAYGTRAGDRIRLVLVGPDGEEVVDHRTTLDAGHARGTYYAGTERPEGGWPPGRYRGTVEWCRDDASVRRRFDLRITEPSPRR
ncbi:MAG: M23 family metallopeptidase [Alphaproteobacteria bacterium]